jgi:hypothetical protein
MSIFLCIVGLLYAALMTAFIALADGLYKGTPTKEQQLRVRALFAGLGFAALGMVLGLSLGMSAAPVIAATLTAGFALVGTLLAIYQPKPVAGAAGGGGPKPIPIYLWLFPFAASLALSMLLGAAIRVNDALDFQPKAPTPPDDLRIHYAKLGVSPEQVTKIMDRLAQEIPKEPIGKVEPKPVVTADLKRASNLQGSLAKLDWPEFWRRRKSNGDSDAKTLEELSKFAELQEDISRLRAEYAEKHADEIVKQLKEKFKEIGG